MKREKKEDCNTSEARIFAIDDNKISLIVEQKESCASCAAASLCDKTSKSGKSLEVIQNNAKDFVVGERVLLNVPQSKAYKAMLLAFGYPLIIMALVCLCSFYLFEAKDTVIVIACIVCVSIYYFLLYLCRRKKYFNFSLFVTKIR